MLWAWCISSRNLPFVCPFTGHIQCCVLSCYSYCWLDVYFNRSGTWVSTVPSTVIWRTEGTWKLPDVLERRWLRRAKQHLGNRSPACKVDCMREQSLQFASFLPFSSPVKVWSPPRKTLLSWATTDSELKQHQTTAAHGVFIMTVWRD